MKIMKNLKKKEKTHYKKTQNTKTNQKNPLKKSS